jgi:hypothetical protein
MNNVFKDVTITHKLLLIVLGLMCTNQLNAMLGRINRGRHWCNRFADYYGTKNWQISSPPNSSSRFKYRNLDQCMKNRDWEGQQVTYFDFPTQSAPPARQNPKYNEAYQAAKNAIASGIRVQPRTTLGIAFNPNSPSGY